VFNRCNGTVGSGPSALVKAKGIVIILCATVAIGALCSRLLQRKVLDDNTATSACMLRLGAIASAKATATRDMRLHLGALVSTQIVAGYLLGGWPKCPSGGTYAVNPIGKDPTCSIPGHSLAQESHLP